MITMVKCVILAIYVLLVLNSAALSPAKAGLMWKCPCDRFKICAIYFDKILTILLGILLLWVFNTF